jgi:hypothetical protein
VNPTVIGILRGVGLAALTGGIDYVVSNVGQVAPGQLAIWQPVIILGLRTLEGIIDHARQAPAVS